LNAFNRIIRCAVFGLALAVLSLSCLAETSGVSLTLSWNAVTTDSDGNLLPSGSSVTYNIYGGMQGQALALIGNVTGLSNVRTNVNVGTLCYAVSAVVVTPTSTTGVEGAQTGTICTTVTASPPPPPKPAVPGVPSGFSIQQTKP
jgi:hypothetical protein